MLSRSTTSYWTLFFLLRGKGGMNPSTTTHPNKIIIPKAIATAVAVLITNDEPYAGHTGKSFRGSSTMYRESWVSVCPAGTFSSTIIELIDLLTAITIVLRGGSIARSSFLCYPKCLQ